jgi:hypothetical protein
MHYDNKSRKFPSIRILFRVTGGNGLWNESYASRSIDGKKQEFNSKVPESLSGVFANLDFIASKMATILH